MSALPQGFVTFASAVSATAINALWEDALLVACVWLLLRSWPRINAATRYAVWCATLVAAIVVPLATTLPFLSLQQPSTASTASTSSKSSTALRHHTGTGFSQPLHQVQKTSGPHLYPPPHMRSASPRLPQLPERLHITLPPIVSIAVFTIWLLLAVFALVRLAIGLRRLEQLKRDALPLPVEYRDAMAQWCGADKGARDVRLCVSDEIDVPVAVGLFDSMILIPRGLLEQLSESEVDQITLHELAHLRRADDWTNGFQRVIVALLAWNPAAQFIGQQLDLEREVACDDWVLSLVGTVRPYARCLTKMAETSTWPRTTIPAPGVFATRKHISLRIERLLAVGRNMATNLSPMPAAAAVAIVGVLAFAIAAVAPSVAAPCVTPTAAPVLAVLEAIPTPSATPVAVPTMAKLTAASPKPIPKPKATAASPKPSTTIIPIAAVHVHVPEQTIHIPKIDVNVPGAQVTVPGVNIDGKAIDIETQRVVAQAMGSAAYATRAAGKAARAAVAQANASCNSCNLSGVDWSGRDLHGVSYAGVDLTKAKLAGTNFSGGSFKSVDFSRSDLRNASFRGAHLESCDFSRANLTGADFTGAEIASCEFTAAQLTSAQLRDVLSSCTSCDFTRANLAGVDLSNVRANGDDFTGADLRNVNFSGAQLTNVDFTLAKMRGVNLSGATLNGCDLSGADLSHVDLSKAQLINTDLSTTHRSPP